MGEHETVDGFDPDGVPWGAYFGFDSPYPHQIDAIDAAIAAGEERGFLAMEAPCGTGKTMAALTAAAHLVRERDRYDTVLIVTPVKQQLDQFVADLRRLNAGLDVPLSGVALVGKADLCPYELEGVFPADTGVNERCTDLREATAELVVGEGSDVGGRAAAIRGRRAGGDRWWNRTRASELTQAAHTRESEPALSVDGVSAPYRRAQPRSPTDGDETLFCPFEADWYARDTGSPIGFARGENHVVTIDEYLPAAVEYGTCPHRVMGVLLESAEVVIGNYNHLFDPRTRSLTAPILDERTFVIVDEAHRLESRVRSLLSDRLARRTILQAKRDLELVTQFAEGSPENRAHVTARMAPHEVGLSGIDRASTFYGAVIEWLDEWVDRWVSERPWWEDGTPVSATALPDDRIEIPLRDPESGDRDELAEWARSAGYSTDHWRSLGKIGAAAEAVLAELDPDRTCVCTGVGVRFEQWWTRDRTEYFREITLRPTAGEPFQQELTHRWRGWFTAGLELFNCIPASELRGIFDSVGGGVLMSATLEPMSIFREVTGLDELESVGRPVLERSYPLSFPSANRASWIVDVPAFTAANRGDPTADSPTSVRETYAYVLRTIARSPGNVLCCFPNYREAQWAAELLRDSIDKPVLLDETSTNDATTALRERFFEPPAKVLVTSTRGTLTEGVDYAGDTLHTCAVFGVPIVNIGSPRVRSVKHAYGTRFSTGNAFEYALTVPAVRRSRQAIGRVIRGPDERGIRILVGNRYVSDERHSVFSYLSPMERDEFVRMTPMFLESQFEEFWGSSDG